MFIELHGPEEQQAVKELQTLGYALKKLSGEAIKDPTTAWNNPIICQRP